MQAESRLCDLKLPRHVYTMFAFYVKAS